jgi:hypothetical protein
MGKSTARTLSPVSIHARLVVKAVRPRLFAPRPAAIVCREHSEPTEPFPFDERAASPVSVCTPRTGLRRALELKLNKKLAPLPAASVVSETPTAAAAAVVSPTSSPAPKVESSHLTFFGVPSTVATFSATPSAGRAYALFSPANTPASGAALRAVLRKRLAHTLWSSPSLCATYGIAPCAARNDFLIAVDDAAAKIEAVLWANRRLHASVAALGSTELAGEMSHAVVKQEAAEMMLAMSH